MGENRKFRSENKYILDILQKENIETYISGVFDLDKNIPENEGSYHIRSMYFDTYNSKAYQDNESGVDNREKYRIRIYNYSPDCIVLERKIKVNGKISKDRTRIGKDVLDVILAEKMNEVKFDKQNPLLNRFWLEYHLNYLRPRNIVDYERTAYVAENIDVRVTFDRNIAFSSDIQGFFDKDLSLQPILSVGTELLEVKYMEFFPEFIHQMLNTQSIQQCTFSKYYLCEKFRRQGELRYDIPRYV